MTVDLYIDLTGCTLRLMCMSFDEGYLIPKKMATRAGMNKAQEGFVCKKCLGKNERIQALLDYKCEDKQGHKFSDTRQKEYVQWNGMKLIPSIRQFPIRSTKFIQKLTGIAMCKGANCRLEMCTYAHNREEHMRFNNLLTSLQKELDRSQLNPQTSVSTWQQWPSQCFDPRVGYYQPPGVQFPEESPGFRNAHGLHSTLLPSPHSTLMSRPQITSQSKYSHQEHEFGYAASKKKFEERIMEELDERYIQEKLSRENYKRKYHNLICWEEKTHIEILEKKCAGEYDLEIYTMGCEPNWIIPWDSNEQCYYGVISGISPDKIAYATQASEAAFIVDNGHPFEVRCEILPVNFRHSDDKLYVTFSAQDMTKLRSVVPGTTKTVKVEFEVKHHFFNSLIDAVSSISSRTVSRIVPTGSNDFLQLTPLSREESRIVEGLVVCDKDEHKKILKDVAMCQASSPPVLVCGAFGTGKTRLLALIARLYIVLGRKKAQNIRVLMVAHHQATADILLDSYCELFGVEDGIVRVTSYRYKPPSTLSQNVKKFFKKCRDVINDCRYQKHHQIELVISTFETSLNLKNVLKRNGLEQQLLFTHILIDEGAQAWEPEAVAPLCFASNQTKIVIVGDPLQVGPSLLVLGEKSREYGLKHSILERLQSIYTKIGRAASPYSLTLAVNHRCNNQILEIPKKLFYTNIIANPAIVSSHPAIVSSHPKAPYPLIFVCSSVSEQWSADVQKLEAELLLNEASKYVSRENWPQNWRPYCNDKIAILTTTRTQVVVVRRCAQTTRVREFNKTRIFPTYQIQGQEFQALFLSTTEPLGLDGNTLNPTKSSCDPFVFNTMLTRAKSLVVVVGNPLTLLRTEEHMVRKYGVSAKCWSNFLHLCLAKQTFYVPDNVLKSTEKQTQFKRSLALKVQEKIKLVPATRPISTSTSSRAILFSIPSVQRRTTTVVKSSHIASVTPPSSSKGLTVHATLSSTNPSHTTNSATGAKNTTKLVPQCSSKGVPTSASLPPSIVHQQPPSKPSKPSPVLVPSQRFSFSSPNPFVMTSVNTVPSTQSKRESQVDGVIEPNSYHRKISAQQKTNLSKAPPRSKLRIEDKDEFPDLNSAKSVKIPKRKQTSHKPQPQPQQEVRNYTLDSHSMSFKEYDLSMDEISCELTRENYKRKFHHLLSWEEQEHCNVLERYNDKFKVVLFQRDSSSISGNNEFVRYGYISCKDTDSDDAEKLSYAKQASEGSFLILNERIKGRIVIHASHIPFYQVKKSHLPRSADQNSIVLGLTEEENTSLTTWNPKCKGNYAFRDYVLIQFELKHSYFQRLHNALDNLPQCIVDRLIPIAKYEPNMDTDEDCRECYAPPYEKLRLDKTCQLQALNLILSSKSKCPLLVAGPFGTGKTRVLARAAFEILKDRSTKVLICAHHQASVDTFVDYFCSMKHDKERPWYPKFIRVAMYSHRSAIKDANPTFFVTVGQANRTHHRLVVTTLGFAPRLSNYKNGYFTHILIDEGAQTREPETVAPLTLAGENTTIVIAGDHNQVGPRLLVFGKEAQGNGLGTSIMERLYAVYEKLPDRGRSLHAELSTNYRCHHGILMLPSHLFYESTLLSRSRALTHPDAPYPLLFVCSSLDDNKTARRGTDVTEADCVLNQVEKYLEKWPRHWGDMQNAVCIMSSSENQCSLIKRKIYKKDGNIKSLEILKAYEIQGREYRAIFISTVEKTDEYGKPLNQTKTLSDRYVFNTAITRSQSLVVVVGNPYLLLRGEDNVGDNYNPQYNPKCWSHYLQRCFESRSFELSETVERTPEIEQKIMKLKDRVYSRCHPGDESFSDAGSVQEDAILKAYKSVLNESHIFTNARLILSREGADVLTWNIKEENDTPNDPIEVQQPTEENYADIYVCVLRMHHFTSGEAFPLDGDKDIVTIRGFNNRKGAFDGDTVEIGVFDDNPTGKCYGRVTRVVERGNDQYFLCQVKRNATCLSPVSRVDPLFINLPFLTRRILQNGDKDSIHDHLQSTDSVVVVFDAQSVENSHDLPQIKKTYPSSVANDMLFLVKFVKWDLKYRNPLGAVIEALPKGVNLYNAHRLLRLQYNIKPSIPMKNDELFKNPPSQSADYFCFTIDPDNARLLDDAISLKQVESDPSTFELGIHIINVAKYVTRGSLLDKEACHRGTSVYPGCSGTLAPIDMLPPSFRKNLSLMPYKKHHAFTVMMKVKVQGQDVSIIGDPSTNATVVESVLKLTYETAQQIMDSEITTPVDGATLFEQKSFITIKEALKSLYLIASNIRRDRLQNDSCFVYDVSDPGEEKCWQAHMMIEELMIFANKHVATLLHSKQPNSTILRRQRYPNMQKRTQVIDEHQRVMHLSHSFTQLVPRNQDYSRAAPNVLVPTRLLEEMLKFNCNLLANRLSSARAIPQLSVVDAQLRSCYAAAEYCYTVEGAAADEYRHYSLNLSKYTHFSSPLRRYVDIVTQQMLTEVLDQKPVHFSREELAKLCPELNKKSKNAKRFESQMSVVALAADLMSSSEVFDGFVCSMEKGNKIELTFSSLRLKHLMLKDRTFRLQHLGRVKSLDKHGCFSIDMKVASMNNQLGAIVLEYTSIVNLRSAKDTDNQSDVRCKLWTVSENDTLTVAQYQANVQPDVVSMSAKQWKDCMEFIKDPCKERLSTVKGHLQNTLQASTCTQSLTTENVSTIGLCPVSFLKLQFKIKPYEMFKVWLSWSGKGAFINPTIQIVELSQFVRVCVQHNSQPAECFSDPILIHASRRTYSDINRYVELWEKIILAEASQSSVRDSSMVILQDVVLRWPRLQVPANCVDEKYYLPTGDITLRISNTFSEHCIEIFKIHIGDLVCARYGVEMSSSTRAVFHFVVCDIHVPSKMEDKMEDWRTVSLKVVGKSNCRISEQVKSILESPCEVQVITLGTSFQRVYSGLLKLRPRKKKEQSQTQDTSELAKAVAIGKITRNKYGSVNPKDVDNQLKIEDNAMCLWIRGKRTRLNKGQEAAIRESSRCAFHLIQGPPGTGKSETGAHLAYIFANINKRDKYMCVMYCGPSNKAVDVVLEKFHKLKSPALKILRIYGKATEHKDFPDPGELGGGFVRNSSYEPPTWAKGYALHHIIRKTSTELQDKEKEFSKLPRGTIPSGKALNCYRKLITSLEKIELLKKYDVIFCTCSEAASARVQNYVHPKQVIIDESGMATEPETIIPISICEHVTVIGDHKQLQPVIEYSPARDKGLSTSLFERYAENEENFTNFLNTQYRMHEEICRFPSQHFYGGKLLTDNSVKQRQNPECKLVGFWPGPQGPRCPILFCDVVGTEMEEETGNSEGRKVMAGSKCNIKDAKKTIQVLSVLHFIHKVDQAQLAVLTPYSSQEVCIRDLADKVGLKDVTVTTIIKSQGDEYGFVVLSTVRSQPIEEIANPDHVQPDRLWLRENLGFVTDEHQTNVAITRSKYGLIIVGNRRLLEYDLDTWKPLIEHYKQNSCIRREREFPRQATIENLPREVRTVCM